MSKLRLTSKVEIDSSHYLRNYDGKCANLHGHRWVVEVTVESVTYDAIDSLDDTGILLDFGVVKSLINEYDHKNLNDMPEFEDINPTAENLAIVWADALTREIVLRGIPAKVVSVKVWETPTNVVEFFYD
jgi:6-pyruvoyltetrahydropterin/6-carboxytetrahydropterin synthase